MSLRRIGALIGVVLVAGAGVFGAGFAQAGDFTRYVDTRIGTASSATALGGVRSEKRGNTQPTSVVPFGMVQWGPDTQEQYAGSYVYEDTKIKGFSLTHLSGPGCRSMGELSIMPLVGSAGLVGFTHDQENATAGYYSVKLQNGIEVELTSSERTGLGRFTFPSGALARVTIDYSNTGVGRHSGEIHSVSSQRLGGWVEGGDFCAMHNLYRVYFVIEFDRPVSIVSDANGIAVIEATAPSDDRLQMKVGLSYVSEAGAALNLQTENPDWSFDSMRAEADRKWDQLLGRVRVVSQAVSQTSDEVHELRKFYTALYHAFLHPNIVSDVDGAYMGFDHREHFVAETSPQTTQYANYSGWDIYRTEIPLLAYVLPERTGDIVQSLVNDGAACGALPIWPENNTETGVMVGDPGPIIVSSAYAFGAQQFDQVQALKLMAESGLTPGLKCNGNESRPYLTDYLRYGYVPWNYKSFNSYNQSASMTLEYASADFATSQFAKSLGEKDLSEVFYTHAANWRNLFDPHKRLIRPRRESGDWHWPFAEAKNGGFTEGNSAQYTWMVPFDVGELVELAGGDAQVRSRLGSFFEQLNAGRKKPSMWIGNEPNFGTPWVYNWTGAPASTQAVVSRIIKESFSDDAGGLPGNDDLGATSSWYVWSALGLYPAIPGVGGFTLGKPVFDRVEIARENGQSLVLERRGSSANSVASVTVNGEDWKRSWIPLTQLGDRGQVVFELDSTNTSWATGKDARPPSYADFQK